MVPVRVESIYFLNSNSVIAKKKLQFKFMCFFFFCHLAKPITTLTNGLHLPCFHFHSMIKLNRKFTGTGCYRTVAYQRCTQTGVPESTPAGVSMFQPES